ncbi:hypothetical protein Ahu01nite_060230 [Winogradskya humida]|uniref:Uncharacterized protein n=1 Tax=Winogradskya humida TaxID=113566 RepID=A0ABQ3ZWE2_9ACTN|nr:hypothetical protein Ahu01nite_060230 [Actinoplanes humidus]
MGVNRQRAGGARGKRPGWRHTLRSRLSTPEPRYFYRSVAIDGTAEDRKRIRKASAQTVTGNDFYLSDMPPEGQPGPAFHVDLDQPPRGTVLYTINQDDPTGIDRFTAAVERVTDKTDHQYRGFFKAVPGEFLPIGVPVVGGPAGHGRDRRVGSIWQCIPPTAGA